MATNLNMPQMGYDMQEGTLVRWLKSVGDSVSLGDAVAEIETDKAVVEFESTAEGVILELLVEEGTTVAVGESIASVGAEGETVAAGGDDTEESTEADAVADESSGAEVQDEPAAEEEDAEAAAIPLPASPSEVRASPVARRLAAERGVDLSAVVGTGPGGRILRSDVLSAEPAAAPVEEPDMPEEEAPMEEPEAVEELPAEVEEEAVTEEEEPFDEEAQEVAQCFECGFTWMQDEDSPDDKECDMCGASLLGDSDKEAIPETIRDPNTGQMYTIKVDGIYNGAIDGLTEEEVKRLHTGGSVEISTEEGRTLTLWAPIEIEEAVPEMPVQAVSDGLVPLTRMRQQIARTTVGSKTTIPHFYVSADIDMTEAMALRKRINETLEGDVRVSVNDLVIKASVNTIKRFPKFNSSYTDDGIRMHDSINVGIAIAEEDGLIMPAILDCGNKSLTEISTASKDLVNRSQTGTLQVEEYTGGTFSISNMGMFDVTSFVAIIQPPQSAVLAIGTVQKRPVVQGDGVVVREIMSATLSVDHRVSDGAEGAQFIVQLKEFLENPLRLLV